MAFKFPELFGPARAMTLRPYRRAPVRGWRRFTKWIYVAAFAFFCFVYGFGFALTAPYLFVPFSVPIVALMAIAIWALPDAANPPTRSLEAMYFAFFVSLVIWPNYLAIALPGLPWVTMLRLTGFPLALLLLVSLSTSAKFRTDMSQRFTQVPLIWRMLVIFVIIQFLTIFLSREPMSSAQKFFAAQVNWTTIFFVSCYIFAEPMRAKRWTVLLWVMAAWLGVLGTWEALERQVLWGGHVPSFLKIDDAASILEGSIRTATGKYRVKTVFSTALGMGEFIALSLPFILHYAMNARLAATRMAAVATVPILFYVVLATDSRLGMVGTLMSFMLYFAFWAFLRWRRNKSDILAPAILFATPVVLMTAFAATFAIKRLRNMVWGSGASAASDAAREAQITNGIPLILKNPLGHGMGEAAETLGNRNAAGKLTIDNYWLTIGLEYGVIGFVVYYGMIAVTIWYATRYAMKSAASGDPDHDFFVPIAVALSNFFVIKWVFSQQDNHPLVFMLMGMLVALVYRADQKAKAEGRPA